MELLSFEMYGRPLALALAGPKDSPQPLAPEEQAAIANATAKRHAEFRLGRHCAHAALRHYGKGTSSLPRAANGATIWPHGMTGSLTHADSHAVAVVAASDDFRGIGIDLEPVSERLTKIDPRWFVHESERVALDEHPDRDRLCMPIFALKEALLKCAATMNALPPGPMPILSFLKLDTLPQWPENRVTCAVGGHRLEARWHSHGKWMVALAIAR